jgi:hypothetical protein
MIARSQALEGCLSSRFVKLAVVTAAAAVGAVGTVPARAGSIRADRDEADYRALGLDSRYASVGSITWLFGLARGSGTLISPRWVLTAGHVVDSSGARTFRAGGTASNNGTAFTGAQNIPHESWSSSQILAGFDIGLIRLTNPVTNIAPASRFTASDEVGRIGTSVGFGVFATGTTPANPLETVSDKRAGQNVLDAQGNSAYAGAGNGIIAADFDDPGNADGLNSYGSTDPLNLEYCVTSGDSGGGVFVDVGARAFIAAVHSFVEDPYSAADDDSLYHDTYGSTRVSLFNQWIDDKICRNFSNTAGGAFATAANWSGGSPVPDQYDIVGFNSPGTYTITIAAPTISNRLIARNGNVTLNLGSSTYTLTSFSYEGSLIVGRYGGNTAGVTVTNGILTSREAVLGEQPLSSGTMTIGAGGTWNVVGDVYTGGNFIAPGGSGTLVLNPGSNTTITGRLKLYSGGTLHLGGGSFSSALLDLAGGTIVSAAPATLSMPITTAGGATVTKDGAALLTITGAQTHGVNTTLRVSAGTLRLDSNAGSAAAANLAIDADSTVQFGSTQSLRALDIAAGVSATLLSSGSRVLATRALTIAASGKLDLTNNKLIVAGGDVGAFNGTQYGGLTGKIASAYNFSNWDGPGITTTMPNAGPSIGTTTLAINTADATFYAGGTFGGVNVSSGDVLVMYTYAGDVNLDGLVDASDYGVIDNYFQFPGTTGYANGDFNYDGVIDAGDYGIIDNTFQLQGPPIPVNAGVAGILSTTAVPEPTTAAIALPLTAAASLMRLRRRRRRSE